MKTYNELGKRILDEGVRVVNERTGEGVIKLFGAQMRFDLTKNFPLVGGSKKSLKWILIELEMFMKGITDNNWLKEQGVKIWDNWALPSDVMLDEVVPRDVRIERLAEALGVNYREAESHINMIEAASGATVAEEEFARLGVPKTIKVVDIPAGSLGPIYGAQWRDWACPNGRFVDQLTEVYTSLRERPFSRRHIVSAWNPADLADENMSAEDNVKAGKMALSPCHAMFQFDVSPMTLAQRREWHALSNGLVTPVLYTAAELDALGVTDKRLSLQLYQRSADFPLGVPYNIASYSVLLMVFAKCLGYAYGDYVHTFGDVHVYENQEEAFREQLARPLKTEPQMIFDPKADLALRHPWDFSWDMVKLIGYDPHPQIDYPIAV